MIGAPQELRLDCNSICMITCRLETEDYSVSLVALIPGGQPSARSHATHAYRQRDRRAQTQWMIRLGVLKCF